MAIGRLDHDTSRERRFRRLAEYAGSSISAAQAREYSNEYRARYDVARRMVPGILPLLDGLGPRARLGVVTNNTWEEQAGKLRLLGVFDRFVGLTASDVVGVPKPDPGIFVAALDQAGVGPEETVMVGDSWAEDVRGAIAAGIPPVWFNRFRSPPLDPVAVPTVISVVPVTATVAAIRDAHDRGPPEALGPRR